jgi:hypothetical protein
MLLEALFADRDAWCETTLADAADLTAMAWAELRRVHA